MLQWILGRFDFLQNEISKKIELRGTFKRIEEEPLR